MISTETLEVCQQPPRPHERDMGTVEPLTSRELEAIARYNEASGVLEDCLDGVIIGAADSVFADHEADFGRAAAIEWTKLHFGWTNEWFGALDALHSGLHHGDGSLSNAAERVVAHEAGKWFQVRNELRRAALWYLIGEAGSTPSVEGGQLVLSGGVISPCVTCGS